MLTRSIIKATLQNKTLSDHLITYANGHNPDTQIFRFASFATEITDGESANHLRDAVRCADHPRFF